MKKFTKKQARRNRIIALSVLVALITVIIVVSVSSCSQSDPAETYTESGPTQADENTKLLTGRDLYDFTQPVPESSAVSDAWFSDALFIGESHIGGMVAPTVLLPNADVCYANGASVASGIGQPLLLGDTEQPLRDILSQKTYGKIYIQFGLNELGFSNKDAFSGYYGTLVSEILALQPTAEVYLLSILPVSAGVDAGGVYTQAAVQRYNSDIAAIAARRKLFYLDIAAAFTGEDGYIDADSTGNGINLRGDRYGTWVQYLRTHVPPEYVR